MGKHLAKAVFAAILAALLTMSVSAATSTWQIDPLHTAAAFTVKHMAISTVRGQFKSVTGTVILDESDITKSTVNVTIDTTTVDTGEPKRQFL